MTSTLTLLKRLNPFPHFCTKNIFLFPIYLVRRTNSITIVSSKHSFKVLIGPWLGFVLEMKLSFWIKHLEKYNVCTITKWLSTAMQREKMVEANPPAQYKSKFLINLVFDSEFEVRPS